MSRVDTVAGVTPHRQHSATKAPTAIHIAVGVASPFAELVTLLVRHQLALVKHVRPRFCTYPSLASEFQPAESTFHPAPMPAQA